MARLLKLLKFYVVSISHFFYQYRPASDILGHVGWMPGGIEPAATGSRR
jgi:hypothetical protein